VRELGLDARPQPEAWVERPGQHPDAKTRDQRLHGKAEHDQREVAPLESGPARDVVAGRDAAELVPEDAGGPPPDCEPAPRKPPRADGPDPTAGALHRAPVRRRHRSSLPGVQERATRWPRRNANDDRELARHRGWPIGWGPGAGGGNSGSRPAGGGNIPPPPDLPPPLIRTRPPLPAPKGKGAPPPPPPPPPAPPPPPPPHPPP